MSKHLTKLGRFIRNHKILSIFILFIVFIIGFFTYKKFLAPAPVTQYVYGTVSRGTISKSVTGSGQVSAENQLDITAEASGRITSITATVGQQVKAGDLIATIDSKDALLDLQSAELSYQKLVAPAKSGDVINAENSVNKSYSDGFAAITTIFLHFPTVLDGLHTMLYSQNGFLSEIANGLSDTSKTYRNRAAASYQKANNDFESLSTDFRSLTKNSPPAVIEQMLDKAVGLEKELAEAVKDAQGAYSYITTAQPEYYPSGVASAQTSLTSWSSTVSSDLSSVQSAANAIDSSNIALQKLNAGADALDVKSAQLSLELKRRAYAKYFVRAPFDGVIGRIPISVYDEVSNGTTIATISGSKKITNIALNEVDAVQVKKGQKVNLTFDAIEGLKLTGEVEQVDLVGTASQGVVTYNVKISFGGSDPRIRTGMSVDAEIITEEKSNIVVVPASALKTQGFGQRQSTYVEVQGQNGTLTRKVVTTGLTDDTNTEIVSGINEGDKIVVRMVSGTSAARSSTPTIFSGLGGGGQRNTIIQNANRGGSVRTQTR